MLPLVQPRICARRRFPRNPRPPVRADATLIGILRLNAIAARAPVHHEAGEGGHRRGVEIRREVLAERIDRVQRSVAAIGVALGVGGEGALVCVRLQGVGESRAAALAGDDDVVVPGRNVAQVRVPGERRAGDAQILKLLLQVAGADLEIVHAIGHALDAALPIPGRPLGAGAARAGRGGRDGGDIVGHEGLEDGQAVRDGWSKRD